MSRISVSIVFIPYTIHKIYFLICVPTFSACRVSHQSAYCGFTGSYSHHGCLLSSALLNHADFLFLSSVRGQLHAPLFTSQNFSTITFPLLSQSHVLLIQSIIWVWLVRIKITLSNGSYSSCISLNWSQFLQERIVEVLMQARRCYLNETVSKTVAWYKVT